MGTSIVVTSGKGGTGKSTFTVGVASCLAAMGKRVLCIDMDMGLRNLDLMLDLSDRALMDVTDVLEGRCSLERAVTGHHMIHSLFLLPAPVTRPAEEIDQERMRALVALAKEQFDFVFLDCPAGIGSGFRLATCAADRAILVCTTDPVSLRAAESAVQLLRRTGKPIHLAVNRITRSFLKITRTTIDDAMDALALPLIGIIPDDPKVTLAASKGQPVITCSDRGAARAFYNIANRLLGRQIPPMKI
ncbi:MAG: septum site-determining protein MinD [Oscillospiraceae bacterium]|nr:septum site-determining protein MinD [Oscillospiraceae bacterium]